MEEKFYKNIEGEYITAISTGAGREEISQEEYENILTVIRNRPNAETGFDYRLKTDLTWELVEVGVVSEDEMEITDDEFMDMLEGVL